MKAAEMGLKLKSSGTEVSSPEELVDMLQSFPGGAQVGDASV